MEGFEEGPEPTPSGFENKKKLHRQDLKQSNSFSDNLTGQTPMEPVISPFKPMKRYVSPVEGTKRLRYQLNELNFARGHILEFQNICTKSATLCFAERGCCELNVCSTITA